MPESVQKNVTRWMKPPQTESRPDGVRLTRSSRENGDEPGQRVVAVVECVEPRRKMLRVGRAKVVVPDGHTTYKGGNDGTGTRTKSPASLLSSVQ